MIEKQEESCYFANSILTTSDLPKPTAVSLSLRKKTVVPRKSIVTLPAMLILSAELADPIIPNFLRNILVKFAYELASSCAWNAPHSMKLDLTQSGGLLIHTCF